MTNIVSRIVKKKSIKYELKRVYVFTCMSVFVCVNMCACVYVCLQVHVCMHVSICMNAHAMYADKYDAEKVVH